MSDWKPDLCIYHANCADGFGAAWAVWRRWGDAVRFHPASYGDAPPDVDGLDVLIVDFSYKLHAMDDISRAARSVVVLDHHKTAEAELAPFPAAVVGGNYTNVARIFARMAGPRLNVLREFRMDMSGATLAWRFCHPGEPTPELVRYVEDRDLWRFALPDSRAVSAYLATLDHDFKLWDVTARHMSDDVLLDDIVEQGETLLRKQDKDIRALIDASMRMMTFAGYTVPVANVPFMWASDAGNILAEGNRFAATYFDKADGTRAFSLRSQPDGLDVSEIAKHYGGGGHKHAAGFQAGRGWEGE